MIDVLRGYLQVASGVTQVTRQKAMDVARQVLEGSPVAGVLPGAVGGADQLSQQVSALADELLEVGRQNRAVLVDLVRAEIETVVTRLGLAGTAELESALAASRARVVQLERELAERDASSSAAGTSAAETSTAKKSAAKKSAAKKSAAKKSAAKKSAASTSAAKKSTASTSAAKKPAAKKSTASKSAAKKSAAKKATARKSAAKKSAARSTGSGS